MKVTVSRDGAVLGTWERADIRAAVADGTLKPDDRYFEQGMTTWLKLSTLTNVLPRRPTANTGDSTTAQSYWKRVATCAGCVLIVLAGASAFFNPSYLTQAFTAAAGAMLILAAQTLP